MWNQRILTPGTPPLLQWQGLQIMPGLNAVIGDEGSGKTRLLRDLANNTADALWLDLRLPEHDEDTPDTVWSALQTRCPGWNAALQADLVDALRLQEHFSKRLFMLSTGSRCKVALVGLLASGSAITCINQPYAALDLASIQVLRDFLQDMAEHSARAWLVADYVTDDTLPWHSVVTMGAT